MAQVEVSQHLIEVAYTLTDSQVEVSQHLIEVAWTEAPGLQIEVGPDFSFIKIVSFLLALGGLRWWL